MFYVPIAVVMAILIHASVSVNAQSQPDQKVSEAVESLKNGGKLLARQAVKIA